MIEQGDYIECIIGGKLRGRAATNAVELKAGTMYKCTGLTDISRAMGPSWTCGLCGDTKHLFVEVDYAHGVGWCPTRFKPVHRPKTSLINDLLAPVDEDMTPRVLEPV